MITSGIFILAVSVLELVDPFIGTSGSGHTSPAAACPFGAVQAGPDTGNGAWAYCGGYRYEDRAIEWFSQDHLTGTGRGDQGDLGLMPFSSDDPGEGTPRAEYDKASETASPGYYAVTLRKDGIRVEATAAPHAALWRFTYREGTPVRLIVDPAHGISRNPWEATNHVQWSAVRLGEDGRSISGTIRTRRWVDRLFSFRIEFDRGWTAVETRWPEPWRTPRYALTFGDGPALMAKIAISGVDAAGAAKNLAAEIPGWDFAAVRSAAEKAWADVLSRLGIDGPEERRRIFTTALYHLCLQPNDIADTDGRYRGADDNVHVAKSGHHYSTFSLWDTFRAAHPLYTTLVPERVDDFVNSMLDFADQQGHLPVWPLWGKESYCMIANHAVPVIVDAYLKGFRGFDAERAYALVKRTLTEPDAKRIKNDIEDYTRFGYIPNDRVYGESVSRTLEMCYDDACAARFAAALGKTEDAAFFRRRSGNWRNLFDPKTGFMRPKDSSGRWIEPFDPGAFGPQAGFTEGNSWQYTWHVLHDAEGLAEALGGREKAVARLEALFTVPPPKAHGDITGMIGQYVHGNEPSHHVAWLFAAWGRPDLTEKYVKRICDGLYTARPDGLCGNEDCGQMSAWYVFACLGRYPLDPCGKAGLIELNRR